MKSEVYSWRLAPDLKRALAEAARREHVTVSRLLERIAREWLKTQTWVAEAAAEQERIRAAAAPYIGALRSGDTDLAEKASERVRELILKAHGRSRPD
jgi:predicted transcriptional regulator